MSSNLPWGPATTTNGTTASAGLLLVLAAAVVSGVSTFVNLYAVKGTSSDAFVTVRNLVVVALLVPIAWVGGRTAARPQGRHDWGRLVLIGVIGGGIPFLLFFHGLQLATQQGAGTTASFTYRTLFLMATVLGVVALRERFHPRVAVAAVALLVGNLLLLSFTSPIWSDGTAYVLAATVMWAVEYTISKNTLRDLSMGTVALARLGIGAAVLVGYLAFAGELASVGHLTGPQWVWVGISALLLTAFVATWYSGLKRIDLGVASAVLVLGFPVSWLLSVSAGGTAFGFEAAVGAAFVAIGVVLAVGLSLIGETRRWLVALVRVRRAHP